MTKISGIYAASMSVLNSDLSLNVEKTIEHAERLIDQGCHGTHNKSHRNGQGSEKTNDFIPPKNAKRFDRSIADEFIPEIKKMVGQDDIVSGGFIIYPPTGYLGWHTNYDVPCKRLYITYASEDKKSFFRYRHPDTKEIITDYDDRGITIREFNVFDKPPYFWHCVGSDCVRISFGYRINPPIK